MSSPPEVATTSRFGFDVPWLSLGVSLHLSLEHLRVGWACMLFPAVLASGCYCSSAGLLLVCWLTLSHCPVTSHCPTLVSPAVFPVFARCDESLSTRPLFGTCTVSPGIVTAEQGHVLVQRPEMGLLHLPSADSALLCCPVLLKKCG